MIEKRKQILFCSPNTFYVILGIWHLGRSVIRVVKRHNTENATITVVPSTNLNMSCQLNTLNLHAFSSIFLPVISRKISFEFETSTRSVNFLQLPVSAVQINSGGCTTSGLLQTLVMKVKVLCALLQPYTCIKLRLHCFAYLPRM